MADLAHWRERALVAEALLVDLTAEVETLRAKLDDAASNKPDIVATEPGWPPKEFWLFGDETFTAERLTPYVDAGEIYAPARRLPEFYRVDPEGGARVSVKREQPNGDVTVFLHSQRSGSRAVKLSRAELTMRRRGSQGVEAMAESLLGDYFSSDLSTYYVSTIRALVSELAHKLKKSGAL
jgi:hypothetical protein